MGDIKEDETLPGVKTETLAVIGPVEVAIAQLARSVELGFREMRVDVQLMTNDLGVVKERVGAIESWRNAQDERSTRTSTGVRNLSTNDAEQLAQLAQERAAREALAREVAALTTSQEVQLAILGRLDKIATNPHVKLILAVVATALMSWAASKGLK